MKKFIGVLVAVVMCMSLCLPCALAADEIDPMASIMEFMEGLGLSSDQESDFVSGLTDYLGGDLSEFFSNPEQIPETLNEYWESFKAQLNLSTGEQGADADGEAAAGSDETTTTTTASTDSGIPAMLTDFFNSLTSGETEDIMGKLSEIFSDFDIGSLLGGIGGTSTDDASGSSSGSTDALAGIADTILDALKSLGIDTSMIEGLLDNDIVNGFANMYIGFIGKVEDETTVTVPATDATTTTTTAAPTSPVVATATPKTGDSSAVVAAIASLSVAAAAAFVCTKKKRA